MHALVVNSDIPDLATICAALTRHGFVVAEARVESDARSICSDQALDLVVLDVRSEQDVAFGHWLAARPTGTTAAILGVAASEACAPTLAALIDGFDELVFTPLRRDELDVRISRLVRRICDEGRNHDYREQYRSLVQQSIDVVAVVDRTGVRRFVSPAVTTLLGWEPAELIDRPIFELVHAADAAAFLDVFRDVAAHPGQHRTTSARFQRRDGLWLTLEVIITNRLRDPSIEGIVTTSRDVTERHRVETAPFETDERLKGSFDHAPIGTALVGLDGRWLEVNNAFSEIVGYRRDELLARALQEITHPDDLETDSRNLNQMISGEIATFQVEKRFIHRDGQPVWVLFSVSLVRNDSGAPRYFVAQIINIDAPRRMQEALRRSEQRFRSLVQHSSDIIMILDERGVVRTVSPVVERILGYSPAEIIGASNVDFAHIEDRASLRRALITCRSHPGNQVSLQARFRHRDGTWKWLEIVANNLLEDESVHGIVVNARDVTERTWAERSNALIKQIAIAIGEAPGLTEAFETVLSAICRSIGWSVGEVWLLAPAKAELHLSAAWFGPTDSLRRFNEQSLDTVLPAAEGIQHRLATSDDSVWLEDISSIPNFQRREIALAAGLQSAMGAPVRIGGEYVGYAVFFSETQLDHNQQVSRTITSTIAELDAVLLAKRHEESLRRSEERFRSLVQLGSDVIWVIGPARERYYVSPSIERILGYTPEEFLSSDGPTVVAAEDLVAANNYLQRLAEAPLATISVELRLVRKDGSLRWFEIIGINQLHDPAVDGIVMNGRDITERKQAETELAEALATQQAANAQLKELSKAKSDFVSVVSHEFRTPLTSIQGFAEIIEHEDALGERTRREFASLIYGEALRLGRLISEMLDLDRMESGRMILGRDMVDLGELIRKSVRQIAPNSPDHTINVEIDPELPAILGDGDKLIQVLSNLLSNAVKYSPGGGEIGVGLRRKNGRAHISVKDEGIGIPQEALEAVFERYTRVDPTKNRKIHGTGLGLAIVRQIVALHDGRVWVESIPGVGSTFHIELPIVALTESRAEALA